MSLTRSQTGRSRLALVSAFARTQDGLQPFAQGALRAVLAQLQEALSDRLLRHQLLRRDSLGAVVRVVVALAATERLSARIGRASQLGGRQHRPVLPHPGA